MSILVQASVLVSILGVVAPEPSGPEDQIRDAVQSNLPIDLAVTEVKILGRANWSPKAEFVVTSQRAPVTGTQLFKVAVRDGARTQQVWASVRLARLQAVLVADCRLAMGAKLTASDLKVELRPVRPGEGLDLTPAALEGQPVLRALEAGEVVGRRDVALPVPVRRGAPVTVRSRVGGVLVEVPGTLLASARPGERARVRIAVSKRPLVGRLTSREVFELEAIR